MPGHQRHVLDLRSHRPASDDTLYLNHPVARTNVDPLLTVLQEGGPLHTQGKLSAYLARLHATGRGQHADRLAALHPTELG